MLNNVRIGVRLSLIALTGVVSLAAVAAAGLHLYRQTLLEDRQLKTRNVVEIAVSLIDHYVDLAAAGAMTPDEAQAAALDAVSDLRYDGDNYFWVQDFEPAMIMHPTRSELNGEKLGGFTDPNGVALFTEMVAVVERQHAGFVAYDWEKPGEERPQPKISYVQEIEDWHWIVGSGIYIDDVDAAFWEGTRIALIVLAALLAIIGGLAWWIGRGISRPLGGVAARMDRLSAGDLQIDVPYTEQKDEVGTLARSLQVFKNNAVRIEEMHREQTEAQARAAADQRRALLALADDLETSIQGLVTGLASASTELSETARDMTGIAELTAQKAAHVTTGSEEASQSVQTVAAATEELHSATSEISRQMTATAGISADAVDRAHSANQHVMGLSDASSKIGEVVQLITTIAEQTNLLALNATIEAARAGDAGKGFAVVASEVKALANQTAKATEEISQQIQAMQSATANTVTAIGEIGEVINQINGAATTVAAAVEEQIAATQEIARNIEQAASGAGMVTANITDVSQAASQSGDSAASVLTASQQLARTASDVGVAVDGFLRKVRTQ